MASFDITQYSYPSPNLCRSSNLNFLVLIRFLNAENGFIFAVGADRFEILSIHVICVIFFAFVRLFECHEINHQNFSVIVPSLPGQSLSDLETVQKTGERFSSG